MCLSAGPFEAGPHGAIERGKRAQLEGVRWRAAPALSSNQHSCQADAATVTRNIPDYLKLHVEDQSDAQPALRDVPGLGAVTGAFEPATGWKLGWGRPPQDLTPDCVPAVTHEASHTDLKLFPSATALSRSLCTEQTYCWHSLMLRVSIGMCVLVWEAVVDIC